MLRCSDGGLLKFISCGIRIKIKEKKRKEMQLVACRSPIWMFVILRLRVKKKGELLMNASSRG